MRLLLPDKEAVGAVGDVGAVVDVGAVGDVGAVDAGNRVPVQEPSGRSGMFVTSSGLMVACVSINLRLNLFKIRPDVKIINLNPLLFWFSSEAQKATAKCIWIRGI